MTSKNPVPARLFVLLAREAPVGVILRRGPSDWVQMIHWDTKKDIFTPGQWFHGRIYEQKCDLSPNGKYFAYCAYKHGNHKEHPDYGDRWTAVSKPPYFTALGLWRCDSRWHGGGLFLDKKQLLLNHPEGSSEPHPNHMPENIKVTVADGNSSLRNSVFYYALRRNGWLILERSRQFGDYGYPSSSGYNRLPLWFRGQAPSRNRHWVTLKKYSLICEVSHEFRIAIRKGNRSRLYELVPNYKYSFQIRNWESYEPPDELDVTWADYDQQRRLILAKDGKLFVGSVRDGNVLADFNANMPEPIETPDWAKKW